MHALQLRIGTDGCTIDWALPGCVKLHLEVSPKAESFTIETSPTSPTLRFQNAKIKKHGLQMPLELNSESNPRSCNSLLVQSKRISLWEGRPRTKTVSRDGEVS